jgi:iron complex outermembrane recepter protein
MIKAFGIFLLMATSVAASANDDNDATGNYFDDFPVVLSASRLIQPAQEAPAAVTVIDRDMIRASGARQIAELFRLVPGFEVSYRNGHAPIVTYHGLADPYARRLQVMIDGVSMYSPAYGGVEWYDLPIAIDDVERIEVVRGPNGASFGANAFVGMVNIITREPVAGDPSDIAVTSGSDGINDWSMRYAGGGDNWSYRLGAGQNSDNGFDGQPDNSRIQHFNLRGRYRIDSTNEFSGTFLHSDGVGTEFYSIERPRNFIQDDVQLRLTRAIDGDETWLQYHHSLRHEREAYVFEVTAADSGIPGMQPFPVAINFDNDQRRDELEFQQSLAGSEQWRLAWGGQLREDAVHSATLFGRQDWLTNRLGRVFGNGEWRPWKVLLLQAGATYEHSSLSGGSVSPRISATFALSDLHSVRVGISKARRTPTPYEDFSNSSYWVPAEELAALAKLPLPPSLLAAIQSTPLVQSYYTTGGLRDEKILSREIAYLFKWPTFHLTGDIRWYWDQTSDLIYVHRIMMPELDRNYPTYEFRNADHANLQGTEASLRWSPWSGGDLWITAARTTIDSSTNDADYSTTAPTHSGSVMVSQQLPWDTAFSAAYYRVGAMQWLGGGDLLPGYERIDVRLAKRFRWGQHTAELSWVTQNLVDSNYPDFELVRRNKRNSWVKFQYTF